MASSNVTNLQSKNAVLLKLPTFWTSQPQVWFEQAGAQFHIRRISADINSALDQDSAYRIIGFLLPPGATDKYRKEPLPRAGSFTSSTALFAPSSLNGDGPVLTSGFPFLSDSCFPYSIITIKQQSVRIVFTGNCEQGPATMRYSKILRPTQQYDAYVHPNTTVLYLFLAPAKANKLPNCRIWMDMLS
ncbi:hypothetical protein T06_15051 [Trichinella sp. T6]|nr:hypothetical protein T06_15051 [Trichinella sp. T6]